MKGRPTAVKVRWIARVWSIATLAFVLAFLGGEEWVQGYRPSFAELVAFLFFPIGVVVGLGLAWWREGLGGAVAIGGLAGFYVWAMIQSGSWPSGPWFAILAAPGLLFVLAWALSRSKNQAPA